MIIQLLSTNEKSFCCLLEHIEDELFTLENFETYTIISWGLLLSGGLFSAILLSKKDIRKWIIRNLMVCAVFVFFTGMLLYIIGFAGEGTGHNPLAMLLRSATASMEMFVSESELIEVEPKVKDNPYYMIVFTLTHFLAICISAAFIIHIMGIRFRSYLNMRFTRKNSKDIFVFFDLSQESISLAKDIYKTKKKDGNYQIVFVKTPMEENHLERFSFSHILNFANNRNETIEELIGISAFLTYSRKSVTIGMDEKEWKDAVGLNNLRRYLKQSSGKKYFFCLSPNEENNISTAVALSKRYSNVECHHIFSHANRSCITESLLHFIDSANFSVMELKKNITYQPVSFVKPDTRTGVATKPFRALIVGFGETGFEVFRFLYEFSAFVGNDMEENPFFCDIIDPRAKQLEDCLYLHCPALEEKETPDSQKPKTHTITFHEGTIESNRNLIVEQIKNIDYIVVCTNNEKENLSIGITLLNLAYKYRNLSDKLGIFIGINDNIEYKKAQEITQFYNKCGRKDKDGNLYEFFITPFGAKEQLFTYKNIIGNDVLDKAKTFYYEYQKTSGLLDVGYKSEYANEKETEWENRRKEKNIDGETGLYYKNELKQKEAQDMANVWHIRTKLYLAGVYSHATTNEDSKYQADERRKKLFECINTVMQKLISRIEEARNKKEKFTDSYDFILTQIEEYEKEHNIPIGEYNILFKNLAKCEHLRWNASNRMLGYQTGNKKHYLKKKHPCMVPNDKLIYDKELKDTIKYDYNTILITMQLNNQEI